MSDKAKILEGLQVIVTSLSQQAAGHQKLRADTPSFSYGEEAHNLFSFVFSLIFYFLARYCIIFFTESEVKNLVLNCKKSAQKSLSA